MKLPISDKQTVVVASVAAISVFLAVILFIVFYLKNKKGMKFSDKGLAALKQFETLRLTAYQDVKGVWTIGWGHTGGVKAGDTCTREQADKWLKQDVAIAENAVNSQDLKINQNQFDALVCFTYNAGVGAFKTSMLLKKIKANPNDPTIASEFARWKFSGGVEVKGLVNRRAVESNLYFGLI